VYSSSEISSENQLQQSLTKALRKAEIYVKSQKQQVVDAPKRGRHPLEFLLRCRRCSSPCGPETAPEDGNRFLVHKPCNGFLATTVNSPEGRPENSVARLFSIPDRFLPTDFRSGMLLKFLGHSFRNHLEDTVKCTTSLDWTCLTFEF
jgi:hypothetical protein